MEETPKVHSRSKHKSSSRHKEHRRREHSRSSRNNDDVINSPKIEKGDGEGGSGEIVSTTAKGEIQEASENGQIEVKADEKLQKGILGYMDRQLKVHSYSDPPRSPAQRSIRSRGSNDRSPKHKRSKSESRRRRERKIIAAGEMEVRQANETLMRYLKQCSDLNDASLSGDLEISENLEDRKVHRKTKSQREKSSFRLIGKPAPSDLTTILNELNDDIVSNHHDEIYNPFTPVVSPSEERKQTIDKIYVQTSNGYRAVDNNNFYKSTDELVSNNPIKNAVQLSCLIQLIWIHISNICCGLLSGLSLAHLLFVFTTTKNDWAQDTVALKHYSMYAEIFANTFFCLSIICFVSILDRMDISQFSISSLFSITNETKSGTMSFRSLICFLIYSTTIILNMLAGSVDERLYLSSKYNVQQNNNETLTNDDINLLNEESNAMLNIWNTLSITRSILAILGWIMIGVSPNSDQLYDYLVEIEKYHLNPN